jgi:hypothetical protein
MGLMEFEPLFFTHYHKIPLKRKSDEHVKNQNLAMIIDSTP